MTLISKLSDAVLLQFISSLKAKGIKLPLGLSSVSEGSLLSKSIKSGHFELYKLLWGSDVVPFSREEYFALTNLLVVGRVSIDILEYHLSQAHAIGLFVHMKTQEKADLVKLLFNHYSRSNEIQALLSK